MAGLNAYSKGVSLGLYEPTPEAERERRREARKGATVHVDLLHRAVPAMQTPEGLRAVSKDRPISPASVQRYLEGKFGDRLTDARAAMVSLARSMPARELAKRAYALYEEFRPAIPAGMGGWGAAGDLDLDRVADLAGLSAHDAIGLACRCNSSIAMMIRSQISAPSVSPRSRMLATIFRDRSALCLKGGLLRPGLMAS